MKPLKQRNRHRPEEGIWGDCHRAAIASILELDLDAVPNFGEGGPDGEEFARRVQEWLHPRGLMQITVAFDTALINVLRAMKSMNPDVYFLLGGESRNGIDHTVVCLNDEIVHDPAIDGSGITGPCVEDGLYWITFFGSTVAKVRKLPSPTQSKDHAHADRR